MPIQQPAAAVAPVVQLPATGVDPTANVPVVAAASPTGVVLPEVAAPAAPALSAHDAALIAQTQAQFAKPAVIEGTNIPAVPVGNEPAQAAAAPTEGSPTAAAGEATAPVELTASQKIAAKIAAKNAQIVKLTAEVQKLEQQFRSADLLDSVKPGSIIVARVGRAETSREVQASVTGVQTLENGDRRLKVFFGEGFDAETVVIQDSQIVDVVQV